MSSMGSGMAVSNFFSLGRWDAALAAGARERELAPMPGRRMLSFSLRNAFQALIEEGLLGSDNWREDRQKKGHRAY